MKKNKDTSRLIFRIGIVIVCLAAASTILVSGIFAKYNTTSSSTDSARVAFFINGDDNIQIKELPSVFTPENATGDYDIYIHNNGETTVQCIVKVNYNIYGGASVPITFEVLDDFGNPGDIVLQPGESSTDLNLHVVWDATTPNNFIYSNQVGYITISLECIQVD